MNIRCSFYLLHAKNNWNSFEKVDIYNSYVDIFLSNGWLLSVWLSVTRYTLVHPKYSRVLFMMFCLCLNFFFDTSNLHCYQKYRCSYS
jgi:hypothetical protein